MSLEKPIAKPLLKWVGGKSKLIGEIRQALPAKFNTYHEPFLGGASVFFSLQHRPSAVYDINKKLTLFYKTVASSPAELFTAITTLEDEFNDLDLLGRKSWFYRAREEFNLGQLSQIEQSALFLALNKTCFNGIYRESASGKFNVPFNNSSRAISFAERENLFLASDDLRAAEILENGYQEVEARAERGDLVYFDPPYVPLSPTSSFTSYHASGFGESQQRELLDLSVRLKSKGVHVVASNSYSPWILENYSKAGFEIKPVKVMRGIAAKASSRSQISEALIV
jgi:DNA adenine methylase